MVEARPRVIVHVDLDSFYPSVEVRENPGLKGLPVIVGADPKGGEGRGVVVSCSYEARKFGVHSGQPISRAFKLCPQAVYLKPNFALYGRVSVSIMNLLRTFTVRFEQVGIDEAFLDVTERVQSYEEAKALAAEIKEALKNQEGFTCSIGIAPNKSTAKIASDFQKPNGLTVVEPSNVREFLAPLQVAAITGVGKKTQRFLKSMSIETIGQLQAIPGKDLVKYFGKGGVWLWGVAHGLEQIEVRERKTMKSLSVEHTFDYDVHWDRATENIASLADKLHRRIVSANMVFKTVGVKIRFQFFQTYTREFSLPNYTDEKNVILQVARDLLREFEKYERKIRLIGLRASHLKQAEERNRGLEAWLHG